jgi:N4-gp56 family major capsid protein
VAPEGKKPTNTDYRAPLAQYGDYIAMTDFLEATSIDDIQTHWAGLLGDQAGYSMDVIERDVVTAGTNAIFANGTERAHVNSLIDSNDLDRAIRFLMKNSGETLIGGNTGNNTVNSFPTMPSYASIIAPYTLMDLQKLPDFKFASEYKGASEGEVGRYKMIAFFIAPDVGDSLGSALNVGAKIIPDGGGDDNDVVLSTSGTKADVYITLVFARHFFTKIPFSSLTSSLIRKAAGSAGSLDPLNQISTMGWKNASARLRTNENWGTRIEHGVSP